MTDRVTKYLGRLFPRKNGGTYRALDDDLQVRECVLRDVIADARNNRARTWPRDPNANGASPKVRLDPAGPRRSSD
jgi:hypothetical protein